MPSSVKAVPSSAERWRLPQFFNRVEAPDHVSGTDAADLPPFRTDSPTTVMSGKPRTLYEAPSFESMTSRDAIAIQIADQRMLYTSPPSKPLIGYRSQHGSLALSGSDGSPCSTGSKTRHSRNRDNAPSQKCSFTGRAPCERNSLPTLPHPGFVTPARLYARSEIAIATGNNTQRSLPMVSKETDQNLNETTGPDLATVSCKQSHLYTARSEVIPPVSVEPLSGLDSFTAATSLKSCANEQKMPTVWGDERGSRNSATSKPVGDIDDNYSFGVHFAKSTATISNSQRSLNSRSGAELVVKARGINFEMMRPVSASQEESKLSFQPLSVVTPPSEQPLSSFSVQSVARRPTSRAATSGLPLDTRILPDESLVACLRDERAEPPAQSFPTGVSLSRHLSSAGGPSSPVIGEKSAFARIEKPSDDFHHKANHVKHAASRSSLIVTNDRHFPQNPISEENLLDEPVSPVTTTNAIASPVTRVTARGGLSRGLTKISAYQPPGQDKEFYGNLSTHGTTPLVGQYSNKSLLEKSTQRRENCCWIGCSDSAMGDWVPVPPRRAETPPLFWNHIQRSDSLFIQGSSSRPPQADTFFPPWQTAAQLINASPNTSTSGNDRTKLLSRCDQQPTPGLIKSRAVAGYTIGPAVSAPTSPVLRSVHHSSGRSPPKRAN